MSLDASVLEYCLSNLIISPLDLLDGLLKGALVEFVRPVSILGLLFPLQRATDEVSPPVVAVLQGHGKPVRNDCEIEAEVLTETHQQVCFLLGPDVSTGQLVELSIEVLLLALVPDSVGFGVQLAELVDGLLSRVGLQLDLISPCFANQYSLLPFELVLPLRERFGLKELFLSPTFFLYLLLGLANSLHHSI